MKKILLFLATEKGYCVLDRLSMSMWENSIGGVVSFQETGVVRSYYDDIRKRCMSLNIPFYDWGEVSSKIVDVVEKEEITDCVVISWRYLLPLEINQYLNEPIIIFHDSLLPKYRGFSPVVTAMLNGDKRIGATVFFATEEADRGDIILQKSFDISEDMYIADVIHLMAMTYGELAVELFQKLECCKLQSSKQNDRKATYSIWRDEEDYWIDWNRSAGYINRFIHALGFPYRSAKTKIGDVVIRITKSQVESRDLNFAIRNPGKIWDLNSGEPVVVCGQGMLRIIEARDEEGHIFTFNKLRTRFNGE